MKDNFDIFFRRKPALMLVSLKKNTRMRYGSILAKEVDCTYSHAVKILQTLEALSLVDFEKRGRIKIIEGLVGHGVGIEVHEDPPVYNYGTPGKGILLREGMVLAIEPMTSLTTEQAIQMNDDSFVTADKSLSAHFEHTVLIKEGEGEVLTRS